MAGLKSGHEIAPTAGTAAPLNENSRRDPLNR